MKTTLFVLFVGGVGVLAVCSPALAHHGNVAYAYEVVEFKQATVTKFLWSNPHSHIDFDVKDHDGNVVHWVCETGGPEALSSIGWSQTSLMPGDVITVYMYPAKTGNPTGRLNKIVLADGTTLHDTQEQYLSLLLAKARSLSRALTPSATEVVRFDPDLDAILSPDSKLEMLPAEGFQGGEGPVWVSEGQPGYLLFSDVPGNRIYKWTPDCVKSPCPPAGKLSVFLEHSGYKDASRVGATDSSGAPLHGTHGLTLDRQHRLVVDATGDRAVERIEQNGERTILAERYEGKRLSCPNDIVGKSDGAIYFTDGPTQCIGGEDSPKKELRYHGVYLVKNGKLQLLDRDPGGAPPQGIALSPDEKTLYVTNASMFEQIFAYDVQPDDTVKNRRLFIDLAGENGLGGSDGLRVDSSGNVYTAATSGLWILSPAGKRLGKVPAPEGIRFASLAFGEPDRKTLYLVSAKNLWRLRVQIPGLSP
jgi:gluconolactonase